jgi:hypothetical protein
MAYKLTENARIAAKKTQTSPGLVFEIEDWPVVYGSAQLYKYVRIGDPGLLIGDEWVIGGFSLIDTLSPYFSYNTGSTTQFSQKLDISRARGSSVSQFVVSLVDKNEKISKLISPGFDLTEVLGRKCTVWGGFADTAWPDDYNQLVRGTIQDIESGSGYVSFIIANADEKKRTPVFISTTTDVAVSQVEYRSATMQDLFFQNRDDVPTLLTVTYIAGGTAGSEVVTVITASTIQVQIEAGVSTATQVRAAIENNAQANQLLTVKITGNGSDAQLVQSVTLNDSSAITATTAGFDAPADGGVFQPYLKIEDELIKYTGLNSGSFFGLTRGEYGSTPAIHEVGQEIAQVWRLTDNGITLALKLMLSGGPTYFKENVEVEAFNVISPSDYLANSIYFDGLDVELLYGVAEGDLVTVTGASIAGNNQVDLVVLEVGRAYNGSFIVVSGTMFDETGSPAQVKFKSQYNVWPRGMGLLPDEVDVAQHQFIRDTFLPGRVLDIYVSDISNGKDFIEQQIYQPLACFSVPRKARASVNYHVGPLPTYEVVQLDAETVQNAKDLKIKRSTSKNFINTVVISMDYNPLTGDFAKTKTYTREEDKALIPVGDKVFNIQSQGIRTDQDGDALADQTARRLLDRYSKGAEFIDGVKAKFGAFYQTEIGDVVSADYASLKMTDFTEGNRDGIVKVLEVINKVVDNKTGETKLDLVNTAYGVDDRLGFISPSSIVTTGSTTTKIKVQKSYGTKSFERESDKWRDHYGEQILVHSEDWSVQGLTVLQSIDNNDPQGMVVSPPLGFTPGAGYIVRIPNYPSSGNPNENLHWTQRYAFFDPQLQVVAGISQTQFTVSVPAAARLFVGSKVRLHTEDFSEDSPEAEVTDITGVTITIDTATGFALNNTHYIELVGFPDKTPAYRII